MQESETSALLDWWAEEHDGDKAYRIYEARAKMLYRKFEWNNKRTLLSKYFA